MRDIARLSLTLAITAAFAGCGGGTDTQSDNIAATDAEVVADIGASNIGFLTANRPAGTWRWPSTPAQHVLVHVPAPASGNTTEQDYAAKVQNAIATINAKLTGLLVLEATAAVPASGNYISVSYGTSYVPPGSTNYQGYCGNVSTGPGLGNVIQPDSQNGIASRPVFLNLGNGHCDVSQEIVTHEFGHALGLANHFSGFGDGPAISSAYWDVLATLYGNPASTTANGLVVHRAAH